MGGLADRIRYAVSNPLNDDHAIDPMRELANVLREVGLEPQSGGGAVTFTGRDPIISSPLPFATMAAVALMAKAVSVAELWRFRGGQGQNLSVSLGKALHRLCPFYDKKWELLNGYAPGNPATRGTRSCPRTCRAAWLFFPSRRHHCSVAANDTWSSLAPALVSAAFALPLGNRRLEIAVPNLQLEKLCAAVVARQASSGAPPIFVNRGMRGITVWLQLTSAARHCSWMATG